MASVLEIANDALIDVGESPVTQDEYDNQTTKGAKVVARRYERAKRQVLHSYHWKDAEKAVKVDADTILEAAADTKYGITIAGADSYLGANVNLYVTTTAGTYYEAPVYGHTRQFTPPGDIIRLKTVFDIWGQKIESDFRAGIIMATADSVYITYTADLQEASMDDSLSNAISLFLASKIANFLGAADEIPRLQNEYFTQWKLAKSFDAQQDSSRVLQATDWLEQRLGVGEYGANYPGNLGLQ